MPTNLQVLVVTSIMLCPLLLANAADPVKQPNEVFPSKSGGINPGELATTKKVPVGSEQPAEKLLNGYVDRVVAKCKEKAYGNPATDSMNFRVVVEVSLDQAGNLTAVKLAEPCASARVNDAILSGVRIAAPFGTLPVSMPEGVRIGLTFDRKFQSGKAASVSFSTRVSGRKKYVVKPFDEEISHELVMQTGEMPPYKLYMELVDNSPVLIRLSTEAKVLLSKSLPRWQGLCEPHYDILDPLKNGTCNDNPVATDIDGDGLPELVIAENGEAGGHPPLKVSIYRLDGSPSLKKTYENDVIEPSFKDVDKDGKLEILVGDDTVAYWQGSAGFQSVYPKIALAFDGKTYQASAMLTKTPTTSMSEQNKLYASLTKELAAYGQAGGPNCKVISPAIWNRFIELIYTGNAECAKSLLSRLYPGAVKLTSVTTEPGTPIAADAVRMTKATFWSMLCSQVKKSKYAAVLAAMNSGLETPPQ